MTAKRNIAGIEKLCQWYNYITEVLKLIVLFGVIMFCTLASQLELEMVFGTGGSIHTFTNVVVCTVCVLLEMVFIILNIHGIRTRQNDLIKADIFFSCIANASCIVAVFINYVNYIYLHQHLLSKKIFHNYDKILGVSGTVAIAFSYCVGDTGLAILLHRIRAIE